ADRIIFIVNSLSGSFAKTKPFRPDDSKQDVGSRKCLRNLVAKIDSWLHAINVTENRVLTIMLREAIEDASGNVLGIRSTVRDRDLRHNGLSATPSNLIFARWYGLAPTTSQHVHTFKARRRKPPLNSNPKKFVEMRSRLTQPSPHFHAAARRPGSS